MSMEYGLVAIISTPLWLKNSANLQTECVKNFWKNWCETHPNTRSFTFIPRVTQSLCLLPLLLLRWQSDMRYTTLRLFQMPSINPDLFRILTCSFRGGVCFSHQNEIHRKLLLLEWSWFWRRRHRGFTFKNTQSERNLCAHCQCNRQHFALQLSL